MGLLIFPAIMMASVLATLGYLVMWTSTLPNSSKQAAKLGGILSVILLCLSALVFIGGIVVVSMCGGHCGKGMMTGRGPGACSMMGKMDDRHCAKMGGMEPAEAGCPMAGKETKCPQKDEIKDVIKQIENKKSK